MQDRKEQGAANPVDQGWQKMEGILDAEMPRKRRRVAGWIWIAVALLVLVSGSVYVISELGPNEATQPVTSKNQGAVIANSDVIDESEMAVVQQPSSDKLDVEISTPGDMASDEESSTDVVESPRASNAASESDSN